MIGPAAMIAIRAHTDFARKERSVISPSSVSPWRRQKPPSGNRRRLYSVSPICLEQIFLPIPTANSSTHTPHFFATIKCPNSWTMTRTPITIKEIMIEESIPITSKNFYIKVLPPLHRLLPMRLLPADPPMCSFLLQYMPPLFFLSMQEYPKIQFCQTGILPQRFHWRCSAP